MVSQNKIFLYALSDPTTNMVRYIGQSKNPEQRLRRSHLYKKENNSVKFNWIQSLRRSGLIPLLTVLHEVDEKKQADLCEIELIKHYGSFCDLTNIAVGGVGCYGDKLNRANVVKNMKNNNPMFNKEVAIRVAAINKLNGVDERNRQRMLSGENPAMAKRRAIIQYDLSMNPLKEWASEYDIKRALGFGVYSYLNKPRKKIDYKGFIWKYKALSDTKTIIN